MTRDAIVRLAHEADVLDEQHYGSLWVDRLERFAALVAAAEREACAQAVEVLPACAQYYNHVPAVIRARGAA